MACGVTCHVGGAVSVKAEDESTREIFFASDMSGGGLRGVPHEAGALGEHLLLGEQRVGHLAARVHEQVGAAAEVAQPLARLAVDTHPRDARQNNVQVRRPHISKNVESHTTAKADAALSTRSPVSTHTTTQAPYPRIHHYHTSSIS